MLDSISSILLNRINAWGTNLQSSSALAILRFFSNKGFALAKFPSNKKMFPKSPEVIPSQMVSLPSIALSRIILK